MDIVEAAKGRWHGILPQFGIDSRFLHKKHGPCPMCGGKDRFIFDNKEGRGTYHCNQCGAGSGLQLVATYNNWSIKQTVKEIGKMVGEIEAKEPEKQITDKQKKDALNKVWLESSPINEHDQAFMYLLHRTDSRHKPSSLRFHPNLWHPEEKKTYPALIAKVTDTDNKPVSIHRTYLDGSQKANINKAKMLMSSTIPDGSAIRLMPYSHALGIAEGIETALSAHAIFGVPVWACISAAMMVKWIPPENIERVMIFADNDRNFVGQISAYRLAHNLRQALGEKLDISVALPNIRGADWNDIHMLHGIDKARDEAVFICPSAFLNLP